jgi:hypothetical protein
MSSKRQGLASKLLTVLGGAGLAISICASRASAQATVPPPWTIANYANRYICNVESTTSVVPTIAKQTYFTGVMLINPNGKGGYQGGSLLAALNPFTGIAPSGNATVNFCAYSLDPTSSKYTVNTNGIGLEILAWIITGGQNSLCAPSFTMTDSIMLRNNVTANNTVPRTEFSTDNFLGLHSTTVDDPGHGYCLK